MWICPFCLQLNPFPALQGPRGQPAAELLPSTRRSSTPSRARPRSRPCSSTLWTLASTRMSSGAPRRRLFRSAFCRPTPSLVITFGTMVCSFELCGLPSCTQAMVHELAYADCPKAYVFRGSKEYQPQIADMLGSTLEPPNAARPPRPADACARRVNSSCPSRRASSSLPASSRAAARPWPVSEKQRPLRCTGVARRRRLTPRDGLPQHWRPHHALRRWPRDRRPRSVVRPSSASPSARTTTLTATASSTSSARQSTTRGCRSVRRPTATPSTFTLAVSTKSVCSR
jgi:hypothetical protein